MTRSARIVGPVASCLAAVLVLGGCSSTTAGTPAGSSGAPTSSGASTSPGRSSSTTGTFPRDSAALAALMKSGVVSLTSAHLSVTVRTGGETITVAGDQTLSQGQPKDTSLTERLPGLGTLKLVIAGGKTYVLLPTAQRTSDKPWALVTEASKNPTVRVLAKSLASTTSVAGVDAAAQFITATKSLVLKGTESLDGVTVGHYSAVIDVARLPASFTQRTTLEQAGINTLPIDLWVDGQGRTRKLTETITVGAVTVRTLVELSKFNEPVTITAPPADQVSTD